MLHKTSYMKGFHIVATDGDAGHADDFLVDESWTVRQVVVDVSNWIGGKSVVVPTTAVQSIDSPGKKIHVRLTRDEVRQSPSVDTAEIVLIETLPPAII